MSSDAIGWVLRHSPYTGAKLMVHLCIADSVNDQHGNQFWMSVGGLVKKTRCARSAVQGALRQMEEDGFLHVIEANKRSPSLYQFVFVEDCPVVYETRKGGPSGRQKAQGGPAERAPQPSDRAGGPAERATGALREGTNPSRTQDTTQEEPKVPQKRERNPLVDALCSACGMDPYNLSREEGRLAGVAAAGLLDLEPRPTADDVMERARNWDRVFPGATITPKAIVNHWGRLAGRGPAPKQFAQSENDIRYQQLQEDVRNGRVALYEDATADAHEGGSGGLHPDSVRELSDGASRGSLS